MAATSARIPSGMSLCSVYRPYRYPRCWFPVFLQKSRKRSAIVWFSNMMLSTCLYFCLTKFKRQAVLRWLRSLPRTHTPLRSWILHSRAGGAWGGWGLPPSSLCSAPTPLHCSLLSLGCGMCSAPPAPRGLHPERVEVPPLQEKGLWNLGGNQQNLRGFLDDPMRKNSGINQEDLSPVLLAQSSRWEEILTQEENGLHFGSPFGKA